MTTQPQVLENIADMLALMWGILEGMFWLYAVLFVLAAIWIYSRPKCSYCNSRVSVGKGSYTWNAQNEKVWLHTKCENLQRANTEKLAAVASCGV